MIKLAVRFWDGFTHVPKPMQPPDQPLKAEPLAAVAVNVTGKLGLELYSLQLGPQLIAALEAVTVPAPVPELATEKYDGAEAEGETVVSIKTKVPKVGKVLTPGVLTMPLPHKLHTSWFNCGATVCAPACPWPRVLFMGIESVPPLYVSVV